MTDELQPGDSPSGAVRPETADATKSLIVDPRVVPVPVAPQPQAYGKYQLLRRLAVGGMAEVFLARQRGIAGFEKLLVIKRILQEYSSDPEFVAMFLDEARLAASMSHPNVVQIFDLGQLDTTYFLAMEYVPGPDLLSIMRAHGKLGQRLPFHVSARVIASVADALAYAHDHKDARGRPLKLVHRDVTPSNILVAYGGTTKLVDFGIAKAESQSSKTAAGKVKGKTRYLSPEQLLQSAVTSRTDLWATGICLYELLTGVRPITGDNELAMMKAILDLEIPRPRSLAPDVPEALDEIVMKCLVRDPALRMPSGEELRRQLESWLKTVDDAAAPNDVGRYLQTFFKSEFHQLEESLAELADRKSFDSSAVARLPSMGLEVTPSGTTGVGKKKDQPEARPVALPTGPRSQTPAIVGVVAGALALVVAGAFVMTRKGPEGTLQVTTQPAGAAVKIDGVAWPQPTPTQISKLAMGPHELEVTLAGYEPGRDVVRLDEDQRAAAVALMLAPAKVKATTLVIEARPSAQRLRIDGNVITAEGAVSRVEVSAGQHAVTAERDGYETASKTVLASAGDTVSVVFELAALAVDEQTSPPRQTPAPVAPKSPGPKPGPTGKRQGTLNLETTPSSEVSLNGQALGKTPLKGVKVPAGELVLSFANDALNLHTTAKVTVPADDLLTKSITFSTGKLAFDIQPWADVYLGSKKLGTTPFAPKELFEGSYTVKLVNAELGALHNLTTTVKPGQTTVVRFDMASEN